MPLFVKFDAIVETVIQILWDFFSIRNFSSIRKFLVIGMNFSTEVDCHQTIFAIEIGKNQ